MKNEEATIKTKTSLIKIARKHFTEYGYFNVSLEKIAEEGNVTRGAVYHHFKNKKGLFTAVLKSVQKDVADFVLKEASKNEDPWQQLILGSVGFIKGANLKKNRRILLIDAPAVLGWETWREFDQQNSARVLKEHIEELEKQEFLCDHVDIEFMTYSISGATNELALNYSQQKKTGRDDLLFNTISQFVQGFKKFDIKDSSKFISTIP